MSVLDSNCIGWIKMSMDSNVIVAIHEVIPEVIWHAGINTALSEPLYYTVLECSDHPSGRPVATPNLRNGACLDVKVLLISRSSTNASTTNPTRQRSSRSLADTPS